jgi:hypothetical protein
MIFMQRVKESLKKTVAGFPNNSYLLLSFFLALLILFFLSSMKQQINADSGSIIIDMRISADGQANLWVNDQTKPPFTNKIISNERRQYQFPGITGDIKYIRIDPMPGVSGQTIKIYGIEIKGANGEGNKLTPKEISSWNVYGGPSGQLKEGFVEYVTGPNTSLVSETSYSLVTFYPKFVHKISDIINSLDNLNIILMMLTALLIVCSLSRYCYAHVLILIFTIFYLSIFSKFIAHINFGSIPVDRAVGLAAFNGQTLFPGKVFILLSFFSAVVGSALLLFLDKRRKVTSLNSITNNYSNVSWWGFFAILIFGFICFIPNIDNLAPRHSIVWGGMYVPFWDSDNAVTWAYMIKNGLIPFKDFWYPYAFSYLFDLAQPWGGLFQCAVTVLLLMATYYLVATIAYGKNWAGLFFTVFIVIGGIPAQNTLPFPQPERHLFPFVVSLAYLLISSKTRKNINIYLFWIASCLSLALDPSQIIYAIPSIGLIFGLNLYKNRKDDWKIIIRNSIFDFSMPIVFFALIISYLYLNGITTNMEKFYFEMGSISNYMAVPTSLNTTIFDYLDFRYFLVSAPFLFFGIGLFEFLSPKNLDKTISGAIMVVSLVGITQLQKHIVRPIDWSLFYSSAFGICLYSAFILKRNLLSARVIIGSVLGIFLAIIINSGQFDQLKIKFKSTFINFEKTNFLLLGNQDAREAFANNLFSSEKLRAFKDERALIQDLSNYPSGAQSFYSPTDNQILYVLAGMRAPYQINGFNMSPIFEQEKTIDYLKINNIKYLIIDPSKLNFDGFSYAVRLPILYRYMYRNYVFSHEFGKYKIFQLKKPGEKLSLKKWISVLGSEVNLGYIPNFSTLTYDNVSSCNDDCNDILKISLHTNVQDKLIKIPFESVNQKIYVTFIAKKNNLNYQINLNRLWFWDDDFTAKDASDYDIKFYKSNLYKNLLY